MQEYDQCNFILIVLLIVYQLEKQNEVDNVCVNVLNHGMRLRLPVSIRLSSFIRNSSVERETIFKKIAKMLITLHVAEATNFHPITCLHSLFGNVDLHSSSSPSWQKAS
jgi:hypothetical protein